LCIASCTKSCALFAIKLACWTQLSTVVAKNTNVVFFFLHLSAIPSKPSLQQSVKDCLKLTTIMETDKGPPLDKIYQEHVQALQHTNLVTEKIPTLTEQPQHNDEATAPKQVKDNSNNKGNRRLTICFCIVHFDRGSKPVHSIVKTINDKFNLQWLMVSASCQTFANTKEILQ